MQLRQLYGPVRVPRGFKPSPELEKARSERVRVILRDAAEARVLRAVLSRRPSAQEREFLLAHVRKQADGRRRQEAFAEIFWGLLNSPEFVLER